MAKKTTPLIKLRDVSLTLAGPGKRPVHILEDVSLEIAKGEALSIVGPSGSGKTSLLMLMAGVEQATSGSIVITGEEITKLSEDELAAFRYRNVGVVFQNFHLIPTMTALENVAAPLNLVGDASALDAAEKALNAVGLGARVHHYPDQLSGGEQQRVAIARAYVTKPALLLADEPTGNLDSENGKQVVELLFGLKKKFGTTLVLITHDKELAKKTSRRVLIKDGRLHAK